MFDYKLALATGVDFPIPELQMIIHQPTILEISMIGEQQFFTGVQLLCINKKTLIHDEIILNQTSNFDLFITIMNEKQAFEKKDAVLSVLALLCKDEKVSFTPRSMLINQNDLQIIIDEGNFNFFQEILKNIFYLNKQSDQQEYNPGNDKAKEIAKKLMAGRRKVQELKAEKQANSSVLGQYLSFLTVGIGSMSLQDCMNLTVFQMYDLVERYSLYLHWDIDLRSRMAGAKADKPLEDWMKNIHDK